MKKRPLNANEPLRLTDHRRPITRREFISQGFMAGMGSVISSSIFSSLIPAKARAALTCDDLATLENLEAACNITPGAGKIPFICFDLAGGANIAGSNVLVGGPGGQMDFLSTAGYSKQGLPGDMVPGVNEATPTATSNGDHTDTSLGLAFHSDSQFLQGILEKTAVATRANINGAVIAARSENDTGNNPHNPMYAINTAGAQGELLALIGSRSSDSGGNSMAPASMINAEVRPTKVDRATDVTGLVDVSGLTAVLPDRNDVVAVMETIARISCDKMNQVEPKLSLTTEDDALRDFVHCGYVKSASIANDFAGVNLNPIDDPDIVGPAGIFSIDEINGSDGREFEKTASVMKLVIEGRAGAGTITMSGYDYHTGDRSTGEVRDLRAGRCMGACLEYAARKGVPLMMYVFTDGSVFSNGSIDNSAEGRGKGVWTGDNQQTSSSFFLVYNPGSQPQLISASNQQLGYMRASGDVETSSSPAANNVNLLVETVALNYMALHGEQGLYSSLFGGLGSSSALLDSMTAFQPIVNSIITDPT